MNLKQKHKLYAIGAIMPLSTATLVVSSCALPTNDKVSNEDKVAANVVIISSDVIVPKPHAKEKPAWGWTVEDITEKNFDGLPTSGNGRFVEPVYVKNDPNINRISIIFKVSRPINSGNIIDEFIEYHVDGFRPENLEEKVNRNFANVEIKATKEAIQIPAIEENWTIEDINDNNFTGLPKSKDGILVTLKGIKFDDSDPLQGKIILTYDYSWHDDVHSITKEYVVGGFEKASYNSNVAAQNHYKLVALYRMVDVKANIDKDKRALINTDDFEEQGITKIKEVFDLPDDRKYNVVTLKEVISSSDNTRTTYEKGENMALGSVKLKFEIFDWVNNNKSIVETDVFTGFENPLDYWKKMFEKTPVLSTSINSSLFNIKKYYNNVYNRGIQGTIRNDEKNFDVLKATDYSMRDNQNNLVYPSYLLPLADWVGHRISEYAGMYGSGANIIGLKKLPLDRDRFINLISENSRANYIGNGPEKPNNEDNIATPIKQGGLTEVLRQYIFDNITNQELYKFDWITLNEKEGVVKPANHVVAGKSVDFHYNMDGKNGIPFGYESVWIDVPVKYDIWLDYTKITITFVASLGMANPGQIDVVEVKNPNIGNYIKE